MTLIIVLTTSSMHIKKTLRFLGKTLKLLVAPVVVILKANTHAGRFYFVPVASADMPSYATVLSLHLFLSCFSFSLSRSLSFVLSFHFLLSYFPLAPKGLLEASSCGGPKAGGECWGWRWQRGASFHGDIPVLCMCFVRDDIYVVACCVFALKGVASLGRQSVRHVPCH
jgi:hypothetical protein